MLITSQEYKNAIDAPARQVFGKVEVYLDGPNVPPEVFYDDDINDFSLLEEMSTEGANPLGSVSSNEFVLRLNNQGGKFTPTNEESPYYARLVADIKVKPYIGVKISPTDIEYVPLGEFYSGNWIDDKLSLQTTVTCHDILYLIGQQNVPQLPVYPTTTIRDMLRNLFNQFQLTEEQDYFISPRINERVMIGWYPPVKVRELLKHLAIAGNCFITTNRYGKIIVASSFVEGFPVATWTDNNQIFVTNNPLRHNDTYQKITVRYYVPSNIEEDVNILKYKDMEVPAAGTQFTAVEFSENPVSAVTKVSLLNNNNCSLSDFEYGSHTMNFTITNSEQKEVCDLEVTGKVLKFFKASYNLDAEGRELIIDNPWIQSLGLAELYAGRIQRIVSDPRAYFTISTRGNPAIELGDLILIQDPSDQVDEAVVYIIRNNLRYDGGLQIEVEARKPIGNIFRAIQRTSLIKPIYGRVGIIKKQLINSYISPITSTVSTNRDAVKEANSYIGTIRCTVVVEEGE